MSAPESSPLPWELVEATEHHGPYITTQWGTTICDLYNMSSAMFSPPRPIHHVDAVANARLIVTAVNSHAELLEAAKEMVSAIAMRSLPSFIWGSPRCEMLRAAIAKAEGDVS
jgi:hypothetical protein